MQKIRVVLAGVALILSACSGGQAESTTVAVTSTPETAAPTTIPSPTTSTSGTTAAGVAPVIHDCTEPGEFAILCTAYDLIQQHYVDEVTDTDLAAAADAGVEEFAETHPGAEPNPLVCAVPSDAFDAVCKATDTANLTAATAAEAAVAGMVDALDPFSAYFDAEALTHVIEDQSGRVEGIGALVTTEDLTADDPASTPCNDVSPTCRLVIVSTLAGSPAERAGVQPGDRMVSVNGNPIDGHTFDEVTGQVRGPAGTDVTIEFERDGDSFTVTITRAAIDVPVVEWEIPQPRTGYLRLNIFTNNSDEQLHQALKDMLDQGIETLVLDLRDNPGGALDAAINITSEFLGDGLVLRTKSPDRETPYPVESGGIATDPDLRMVVVVNRGSASASEVLTGALMEAGRAVVVGDRTFGKNSVQQRFSLPNGGALKLTIARWTTPGGHDFGKTGLTPDVSAEFPATMTSDQVTSRALELTGLG